MIQLLSTFKWISGHLKAFLLILLIASLAVIYFLWQEKTALKTDNARIGENFEQKDKQVCQMNLTIDEFKKLQSEDKITIDSLCSVIRISEKQLKEATVIRENYKDTNEVEPNYSEPIINNPKPNEQLLSKPIYSIPISFGNDSCWGIKGIIKSTDPGARLLIKERTFVNSIELLIVKKKKFLWWTIREEQFKAFSDCQKELKVTRINFVKK